MAIKNASDLLIYKKSPADVQQRTKIKILNDVNPLSALGNLKVTNVLDASGVSASDLTSADFIQATNNALSITTVMNNLIVSAAGYTSVSNPSLVDGYYEFEVQNVFAGDIDSVIDIINGTAILKDDFLEVLVTRPGETNNAYEPIAFSTSASLSITREMRDVTNKDSGGWSESLEGLKSFEMTSDALQDFNADLSFREFFDDLAADDTVTIRFAERGSGQKYEGEAYVSSLSLDAGVEDNATYSVTLNGTASVAGGTY